MNNSTFIPQHKHNGTLPGSNFTTSSKNTTNQLENRSYGFKELAVLYFPNIAPASASIRLKAWIKDCPELLEALNETHYHLTARVLTPRQSGLIAHAFGSPY